jgi:hypothetical protein
MFKKNFSKHTLKKTPTNNNSKNQDGTYNAIKDGG